MSLSRLVFLSIPFLLFLSCSDNGQVVDPGETPTILTGRVVDSEDPSEGLAGATVRIAGTDQVAVTNEDGYFEFEGLTAGDVTVVVESASDGGYRSNSVEVSIHEGDTVDMDVTVLPGDADLEGVSIWPGSARAGILESVHFYAGGIVTTQDSTGEINYEIAYRPTWSIRSESPIGVISRDGIFIGTTAGHGEVVASFSDELQAVAEIDVVTDDDVARIYLSPFYRLSVEAGESRYLAAWAVNGAGDVVDNAALVWDVVPDELGAVAAAEGLTEEERTEILGWLLMDPWTDYLPGGPGDVYGGGGGDDGAAGPADPDDPPPPVDPPPPGEGSVDPDKVSLVLFTASADVTDEETGSITVKAEGESWKNFVDVRVYTRGTLTEAHVMPEEATLSVGDEYGFYAYGLNEFDRGMSGLEYEWEAVPASLGELIVIEISGEDSDSEGPGYGGGWTDSDESYPGDDPVPPDNGVSPPVDDGGWPSGRYGSSVFFEAGELGDGELRVTIYDPVANISIERTASVRVAPPPVLHKITVRPNPVEASPGDSVLVEAVALNDRGEVDWTATIGWTLTGGAGLFHPFDYFPEYDDSLDRPDRPGGGGDEPVGPDPGNVGGRAYGFFVPGAAGAEGVLRVEAVSAEGATVTTDVPVRVTGK